MIVEVAVFASIRDENATRNLHLPGGGRREGLIVPVIELEWIRSNVGVMVT